MSNEHKDHPAFKPFDAKDDSKKVELTFNDQIAKDGAFKRKDAVFRNQITGKPEAKQYLLYVCWGCPWANRTLIMRALKGLEDAVDVAYVYPELPAGGWFFKPEGGFEDPFGRASMREVYQESDPGYSGAVTVPTLYDTKARRIVNNESSEIIRMLNSQFNHLATKNKDVDYYPESLKADIDGVNEWIYHGINNGVYKAGFCTSQEVYEAAIKLLFDSLDRLEKLLSDGRSYLVGGTLTEADIRLWVTLVRFPCYEVAFKCNLKRLREYRCVHAYMVRLYQEDEFQRNVRLDQCRNLYFKVPKVNPSGIVPLGNREDWYKGPWFFKGQN